MSELVDKLMMQDTGIRSLAPIQFRAVPASAEWGPEPMVCCKTYDFILHSQVRRTIPDVPGALAEAMRQERRRLNELIYGAFRNDLYRLTELALDCGNDAITQAARELVARLDP